MSTTTPAEPRRLAREEVEAAPWRFTAYQWKIVHGVHVPWIAEISPYQLGSMGKQQRARYDKERAQVWQTSIDSGAEYRAAVVAAFDAGRFDWRSDECEQGAKSAVFGALQEREAAEIEAARKSLNAQNRDMTGVKVGDIVYSLMSQEYAPVLKLSAKSVRIPSRYSSDSTFKVSIAGLQWLDYNDIERLAKAKAQTITRKTA